jgi:hypothetical protein
MPPTQGIGREEVRKAFPSWSEVLKDGEYKSLFASRFRVGDLPSEDGKFLVQDQQFEVFE